MKSKIEGLKLKELRLAWKLTVKDFAGLIGVNEISIWRWEGSRHIGTSELYIRIIKKFIQLNEDDEYIKNCLNSQIEQYGYEEAFFNLLRIAC